MSEPVSSRNRRLLTLSVMKRRTVVVAHTCAAVNSAASVSLLAGGAGRSTILGPSAEAAMVPEGSGCGVATGEGSPGRPAAVEGRTGILGSGISDSRVFVELLEAVVKAVLSGAECCHLAGEVSDLLCGVVRG
jgi:hypothetical protein